MCGWACVADRPNQQPNDIGHTDRVTHRQRAQPLLPLPSCPLGPLRRRRPRHVVRHEVRAVLSPVQPRAHRRRQHALQLLVSTYVHVLCVVSRGNQTHNAIASHQRKTDGRTDGPARRCWPRRLWPCRQTPSRRSGGQSASAPPGSSGPDAAPAPVMWVHASRGG